MKASARCLAVIAVIAIAPAGCQHPTITAVSLSEAHYGKQSGIPFYLPKPLLIIAKNFRAIEEAKVGLTDSAPIPTGFDDQAKYADLNARTNFAGLNGTDANGGGDTQNGGTPDTGTTTAEKSSPHVYTSDGPPITPREAPSDGLAPATFYTYHIVFVPDLTQKYGLKVKGGVGEIRAAMNLVNGWQFTGLGPYYMKDSSTAQNVLASGIAARLGASGVADVVNSIADLSGKLQDATVSADDQRVQRLAKSIEALPLERACMTLPNFAEIHVFEARIGMDGQMEWCEIANLSFDRQYLGAEVTEHISAPAASGAAQASGQLRAPT